MSEERFAEVFQELQARGDKKKLRQLFGAWVRDAAKLRDKRRRENARRGGYPAPPKEKDCPPIPNDGICQCCNEISADLLHLDHCHKTGAFRGWVCGGCNTGIGLADSIERLEKRIAFLKKLGD
jgi:hypothetical protein